LVESVRLHQQLGVLALVLLWKSIELFAGKSLGSPPPGFLQGSLAGNPESEMTRAAGSATNSLPGVITRSFVMKTN
jgi:hypothetical protein